MEKEKNYSYTIQEGPHKGETLWSGCYSATCGITILRVKRFLRRSKYYVLANKRGKGTPDFKHMWNLVCGFIEPYESGPECVSREILEECGINIPAELFVFLETDTRPETRNKGHITLRYLAIIDKNTEGIDSSHFNEIGTTGGEVDEVEERKWIDIDKVREYEWAFNHAFVLERRQEGASPAERDCTCHPGARQRIPRLARDGV